MLMTVQYLEREFQSSRQTISGGLGIYSSLLEQDSRAPWCLSLAAGRVKLLPSR